jgi:hypothetical protein
VIVQLMLATNATASVPVPAVTCDKNSGAELLRFGAAMCAASEAARSVENAATESHTEQTTPRERVTIWRFR